MKDCTPLHVLKTIVTAGRNELPGTATGILYGTIVDQTSNKHQVESPNLIVSDLGRKLLFFPVAMKRGIITIFEEGNPHLHAEEWDRGAGTATERGLGYDFIQI